MVEFLLNKGANVNAVDGDGMTPLQTTCSASKYKEGDYLGIAKILLKYGADVNVKETSDSTVLHILSHGQHNSTDLLQLLLESGADPTLENIQGWTPLHIVNDEIGCKKAMPILEKKIKEFYPEFLATFDPNKPKSGKERPLIFSRLSPTQQSEVLNGELSLKGIANRILSGRSKRIIVLTGAGVSGRI